MAQTEQSDSGAMAIRKRVVSQFSESQLADLAMWFIEQTGDEGYSIGIYELEAKIVELYDAGH